MREYIDNEWRRFYFVEKDEKEDFYILADEIMKIAVENYQAKTAAILEERIILISQSGQKFQGVSIKREHKEVIKAIDNLSKERIILKETYDGFETFQGEKIEQRIEKREY